MTDAANDVRHRAVERLTRDWIDYFNDGDYATIVERCNAALKLLPDHVFTLKARARAYQEMERHNDAIKDLDRAMYLDGSLGNVEGCLRGKFDSLLVKNAPGTQLLDCINRMVELSPDNLELKQERVGILHNKLNETDVALLECQNIIRQHPNRFEGYGDLCVIYRLTDQLDKAIEIVDKRLAVRLSPQNLAGYKRDNPDRAGKTR